MHPLLVTLELLAVGLVLGATARLVLPGRWRLSWPASVLGGIVGAGVAGTVADAVSGSSLLIPFLFGILGTVVVLGGAALVWRRVAGRRAGPDDAGLSAAELVELGEGDRLEFKSTARRNLRTGQRDEKIELVVAKTVAGFLNGDGGTLLVGVADDGSVVGLGPDYDLLKAPDDDRYEGWLRDFLSGCLGTAATTLLRVSFEDVRGERVCRIEVPPSPEPVFLDPPKGERTREFWVRTGNSTRQLRTDEVLAYHRRRWP